MFKNCECGCGQQVPLSPRTHRRFGWIKGVSKRFINGHQSRNKVISNDTKIKMSKSHTGLKHSQEHILRIISGQKQSLKFQNRDYKNENNPKWRGGRTHNQAGYILIKADGHPNKDASGYVLEHRLVMEGKIGRYLLDSEVVHHINHNKKDNNPINLQLFASNSEHKKIHHR